MPLRSRSGVRWRSGRTVVLTVVLLLTVPACLFAGWWQWQRARSGNALSYGYMIEWPIFAALAIAGWWQLVRPASNRAADGTGPDDGRRSGPPAPGMVPGFPPARPPLHWDADAETPELQAYNAALAEMAATGRGLPRRRLPRRTRAPRQRGAGTLLGRLPGVERHRS